MGATVGQGITIDECAVVSRALEAWLDASGLLGTPYVLEVSSPRIQRPVRWAEHWERFIGRDVRVRVPQHGRVRARIEGLAPDREAVTLRLRDTNEVVTVRLEQARDATLAVDWDGVAPRPRGDGPASDEEPA